MPQHRHPNRLLAALGDDLELLRADLNVVSMRQGETVCEADQPVAHAYFPHSGMISMVAALSDGSQVEACLMGRRGAIGLLAAAGPGLSFTRDICQVAGEATRIETVRLRAVYARSTTLQSLVLRLAAHQLAFTCQSVACNARHMIEQRLCRWLLTCCDAVEADSVPMTQEFISFLLGVRRTTVTIAAGELQRRGMIVTHRGRVTLTDRAALEDTACECYAVTRRRADAYLPPM